MATLIGSIASSGGGGGGTQAGFSFYRNATSTTMDVDPGTGYIAFDNNTAGLVSTITVSMYDTNGDYVGPWMNTFANSTSTTKGTLFLRGTNPTDYRIYTVNDIGATGPYTWIRFDVQWVVSDGTFSDNLMYMTFAPTGDAGS